MARDRANIVAQSERVSTDHFNVNASLHDEEPPTAKRSQRPCTSLTASSSTAANFSKETGFIK